MINVKKIGAITTGAMFLGATFGMASAVDVPTAFKTSLLASGGVAKAQLVVGANAPGATADMASAEEIQDAVKVRMATTVGGDIRIEFGSKELHDDSTAGDDFPKGTFSSLGYNDSTVNALPTAAILRFDENADDDLKDSDDYDLYNAIVIIDDSNGDIQFAYNWTVDGTYATQDGIVNAGDVIEIKGDKYVITDNKTSDSNIELGPAITKKLTHVALDKDNAVVVAGTKKVLFSNETMYFYDGGSLLDSVKVTGKNYPYKMSSDDITSDEFKIYKIYVIKATANTEAILTMVEKSQEIKLTNDEEGVFGYSQIKIADSDWFAGGLKDVYFLSDPISLVKGSTIDLPDTYYQLKWTSSKVFDIKRKKVSAIASGTKLKTNTEPGDDFLSETIKVFTTGGTAASEGPTLEIVDEDTADQSMNLLLIGGPVANTMTSDLVENGKSKVDWYTSEGDIEVISSAFKSGKYGIIIAGDDRFHTADAAVAVAAEI